MSLTIHMMTPALSPGDAIGNYIFSLTRILRNWGCTVHLYADHPNDRYLLPHFHSSAYQPTGRDLLWVHYSIFSDNVYWLRDSPDFTILDSHNVSPAHLFRGYDARMEELCRQGEALLGTFVQDVDLTIAHTDYVAADLQRRGYTSPHKLPLIVDTERYQGADSAAWEPLLRHLDYLLFVGRIVPQKDLKRALRVFAALRRRRQATKFFLVGAKYLPTYAAELESLAGELGIEEAVVFTGPIAEPEILASFYRHARFYLALSEWESFCVPIVESLFFGTPIVGHAVEPIPETMGPGGTIIGGTPEEMAGQIDALWDDSARYRALQHAGLAHAQQFTEHQLKTALISLFADIAKGS